MRQHEAKQERLVRAAQTLFHQQGVHRTTLADVALAAEVPLGNVYYHFRTKDALVSAVIEAHIVELQAGFAQWEHEPDVRQRVVMFLEHEALHAAEFARFGCPYGSLAQELDKGDTPLATAAAQLFQVQLAWLETQFRLLGRAEDAPQQAVALLAAVQGTLLLTNTFRAPDLLTAQMARLAAHIGTLAPLAPPTSHQ
jgi:AcrR family transcriptional regulator